MYIILSTTPVRVALFLNDNRIIPVVVVNEHFMVPKRQPNNSVRCG